MEAWTPETANREVPIEGALLVLKTASRGSVADSRGKILQCLTSKPDP